MSTNKFKKKYYELNSIFEQKDQDILTINISFLDILSEKNISYEGYIKENCQCIDPKYVDLYYTSCPNCNGKGNINILGEDLICNKCKGLGKQVINHCSICENLTYNLIKTNETLKLNRNLKNDEIINLKDKPYLIKIKIFDFNKYEIKDNNLYLLEKIYINNDQLKQGFININTPVGEKKVKFNQSLKEEIIEIKNVFDSKYSMFVILSKQLNKINGKSFNYYLIIKPNTNKFFLLYQDILDEKNKFKQAYYDEEFIKDKDKITIFNNQNIKTFNQIKYVGLGEKGKNGGNNGDLFLTFVVSENAMFKNNKLYDLDINFTRLDLIKGEKTINFEDESINFKIKKEYQIGEEILIKRNYLKEENLDLYTFFSLENIKKYQILVKIKENKNQKIHLINYKQFFFEEVNYFSSNLKFDESFKIDYDPIFLNSIILTKDDMNNIIEIKFVGENNE